MTKRSHHHTGHRLADDPLMLGQSVDLADLGSLAVVSAPFQGKDGGQIFWRGYTIENAGWRVTAGDEAAGVPPFDFGDRREINGHAPQRPSNRRRT